MKKVLFSILALLGLGILAVSFFGKNSFIKGITSSGSSANIFDQKSYSSIPIKKGKTQAWEMSDVYNQKALTSSLDKELQTQESIAFLVLKDGKLDVEKYWREGSVESSSNSFSMAKSIVSSLIGIAMKENKIDNVFQTVGDFFPEFNNQDKEKYFNHKLEIRHLLSMKSGLNWEEKYDSYSKSSDIKSLVLGLKVTEEPGKNFKYQSANTQLLALILEKVTGKSISEYASEKLWQPLGAKADATWSTDEKGEELAFSCINSNARDFARIGQLYLNKGNWKGNQILPSPFIDISTQANNNDSNYGYHWWVSNKTSKKAYYMQGLLGQYVVIIPELNVVMVRLGHKNNDKNSLKIYIEEVIKMYS